MPRPTASPIQIPAPSQPRVKGEPAAKADADHPIAECREQHGPGRILQSAQHPGADHLRTVDNLENSRDQQERNREVQHLHISFKFGIEEKSGECCGKKPDDQRHCRHKTDAQHIGRPARASDRVLVQATKAQPDPHGRRLPQPHRDHEGHRCNLDRNRMRRDRTGADIAHQEHRCGKYHGLKSHMQSDGKTEPPDGEKARSSRHATSGRTDDSGGISGGA